MVWQVVDPDCPGMTNIFRMGKILILEKSYKSFCSFFSTDSSKLIMKMRKNLTKIIVVGWGTLGSTDV